jgi:predicted O-methyltransferase YrrM
MSMRKLAGFEPGDLNDYFDLAAYPEVYGDSGICAHLPYLRSIAGGRRVVELGTGGGDQSSIAFLAGHPVSLTCHDVNVPGNLPLLQSMAAEYGIEFRFVAGATSTAEVTPCDVLFVDTLHDADTVEVELARFAPTTSELIVFHDVVTFGRTGQWRVGEDQGINLAIADFLFRHPEWQTVRFDEQDNGLLTLGKSRPALNRHRIVDEARVAIGEGI